MIALYPRLAVSGIKKNRKLYYPYILTCVAMVTMFYIVHSLSFSPTLHEMTGGGIMETILGLGKNVIAIFSAIFLLYTNSLLIRRRNKEFGLYHVLGMGKSGLMKVLLCETVMVAAGSIAMGIALGIVLSKAAELFLANLARVGISYEITVSLECIRGTATIFGTIFLLIMGRSLWTIWRSDPLALLRSEAVGEKPPRANYLISLVGLILLAAAYYFALSIESPSTAMLLFFVLVVLVIIATYLLFISGSVTLCRVLQKNPRYYYRKNHFVSVSTMAYRMKRNGAGLASICILATMVLVMLSSSMTLYVGVEDIIGGRYSRDSEVTLTMPKYEQFNETYISQVRDTYEEVFRREQVTPENVRDFRYASTYLFMSGSTGYRKMVTGVDIFGNTTAVGGEMRNVFFMTAQEYNALCGASVAPGAGEAYLYDECGEYGYDSFQVESVSFAVKGSVSQLPIGNTNNEIPNMLLVISDFSEIASMKVQDEMRERGTAGGDWVPPLNLVWCYACDFGIPQVDQIRVFQAQLNSLSTVDFLKHEGYGYSANCPAEKRAYFYEAYGSLFFVGIILSAVFLGAAALIIYYKQISEGYEDQARFEILQKVGMTKSDIRKSVNSQVLTVFFAPLLAAGLHMTFAFPIVWRMLKMFEMKNLHLMILVTVAVFLAFGVFYAIVYRLTTGVYYGIVSSARTERRNH